MNTIESLKELYVKLGGSLEDVKNKTTIPEMIDAITEVAGGSEPTYETVAEIPVGTMVENHGFYTFQPSDSIPLARNETLFFNSEEYPLEYAKKGTIYYYNFDVSTGAATGTPSYVVNIDGDSINGLISDTDLSNTTVKILKKVEQGGGAGKLVVHLTEKDVEGEKAYSADKSVAEIIAADAAGQVVECVCDGMHCALSSTENSSSAACAFSIATLEDDRLIGLFIIGSNDKQNDSVDKWEVTESEVEIPSNLKPTYEFVFSAEVEEGNITIAPASGVTYAAISSALAETPHVFAKIAFPSALGLVVTARFNESVTGDGQTVYYANGLVILGGNPTAIGLNIGDNAGQTVCVGTVKTLAVAT